MAEVKKLNGYDIKDYQLDALQVTANQGKFFKVNSDNSITVSDTITSDNAGDNITITSGSTHDLPSGYTELEYLQSSGTQYIDTGLCYNTGTDKVLAECKFNTITSSYQGAIGGRTNSTASTAHGLYFTYNASNVYMECGLLSSGSTITPYALNTTDWYSIKWDGLNPYINDVRFSSFTYSSYESTANIYLFGAHTGSPSAIEYGEVSIRSFKYYRSGSLIMNLIPAKRNSDSVFGMYDLANDVFYTNSGTGTFTAGPELSSATKINALSGLTSTVTELNYCDGVTSNIQTQLNAKPDDLTDLGVTSTAAELNKLDGVTTTTAQLNYLNTATSNIQTQLNAKSAVQVSGTFSSTVNFTLSGTTLAITTS